MLYCARFPGRNAPQPSSRSPLTPQSAAPSPGRHRWYRNGAPRLSAASPGPSGHRLRWAALSADEPAARSGGDPTPGRLLRRPISCRRPDVVVIGNAVRRDNPEAVEAERLGLPRLSMPEALARFFLADRQPLVVAGTHGKTTTSAMAAWVWSECGRDPGFLIGGVPLDLGVELPARQRAAFRDRGRRVQRRLLRPRREVPALPSRDAPPDLGRVRPRRSLPEPGVACSPPMRG